MKDINYIFTFPGLLAAKNQDSVYLAVSQEVADIVGWKDAQRSIGKSDYDLSCGAVENASQMINLDRQVFQKKKKMVSLEVHQYKTGWKSLLAERNPFKSRNLDAFQLLTYSVDITNSALANNSIVLSKIDKKIVPKTSTYILTSDYISLPLTERQQICLFLLIRGKTAKNIASILNISIKTIEEHTAKIKQKMNCFSKSQLIEKAIDNGFLFYIPQQILHQNLERMMNVN